MQNEDFFGGDLNYPTLTESSTSVLQKYPYCQFCSIWVPKLVFLRVNFGFKVCDSATLQECGKHRILEMQINLTKCSDKATAGFWILLEEALFSFLAAQCTAFSRLLPLLLLLLLFHTSNRNNRVNLEHFERILSSTRFSMSVFVHGQIEGKLAVVRCVKRSSFL